MVFSREDSPIFRDSPDSDKNDVFHKFKHTHLFTNSPLDSTDKYIKYIIKKRNKDFKNPLQWRDHELSYTNGI